MLRLDVEKVGARHWTVKAGGELLGLVTRASGPDEAPAYRAAYVDHDESRVHEELFRGEFGNVDAVATILHRAVI